MDRQLIQYLAKTDNFWVGLASASHWLSKIQLKRKYQLVSCPIWFAHGNVLTFRLKSD